MVVLELSPLSILPLPPSLPHSLPHPLAHSLLNSFTHLLTRSLTLYLLLTHSLAHSLTLYLLLTRSLAHLLIISGLLHLCEFIEDCEHVELASRILHLLGREGTRTSKPHKFIRFIYNRVLLESPPVRAGKDGGRGGRDGERRKGGKEGAKEGGREGGRRRGRWWRQRMSYMTV